MKLLMTSTAWRPILVALGIYCVKMVLLAHVPSEMGASKPSGTYEYYSREMAETVASMPVDASYVRKVRRQRFLEDQRESRKTVSLIAACQNRPQSLEAVLFSWRGVRGLDQIVVVDFGSEKESDMKNIIERETSARGDAEELFVTMNDTRAEWAISRAYNLAASLAFGDVLVKVDCDSFLTPDFLEKNSPSLGDVDRSRLFVTAEYSMNQYIVDEVGDPLSGVFLMARSTFESVGGFDERFNSYGGENVDLYERLRLTKGMALRPLDRSTCHHLEVETYPSPKFGAKMSSATNREAVRWLPKWSSESRWHLRTTYTLSEEVDNPLRSCSGKKRHRSCLKAVPIIWAEDAADLLSADQMKKVTASATEDSLVKVYKVPRPIVHELTPAADAASLLDNLKAGSGKAIFLELDGSNIADRLHNLARFLAVSSFSERPIVVFWARTGTALHDSLDLKRLKSNLETMNLKTQIFSGYSWPCAPAETGLRRECPVYKDVETLVLADTHDGGHMRQEIDPVANKHASIRLGSSATALELLPISLPGVEYEKAHMAYMQAVEALTLAMGTEQLNTRVESG